MLERRAVSEGKNGARALAGVLTEFLEIVDAGDG